MTKWFDFWAPSIDKTHAIYAFPLVYEKQTKQLAEAQGSNMQRPK